ncbi:hypothetical protein L9F63_026874 [Diploptera punctata]|uniref:RAP domain-containing protein n=1 Tax=Diploptera punctata TaxID=6984 RepID=A0AAD8AG87_DIPPU|nr:hypothetical protein L9F63_026874 [Diploptera punctata]
MAYPLMRLRYYPQKGHISNCSNLIRHLTTKDIVQHPETHSQDFLMQHIKSTKTTSDILQVVGNHYNIMNGKHVIQALKSLFELEKSENSKFSKKQIINNPEFLKLCKRLNSQARGLSINETIDALKIVTYIDFLLKNLDKNPLVDALKIALPLVFEAQLSLKMNRYDAIHLADLLHYATEKKMSDTSLNLIINSLDKVIDDIDVKTARTIVRSLYGNKTSLSSYNMLLTNCWNVLAQNIDQYSYNGMEELLHWMEKKYCKKQTEFYHEDFVDNCASYIVSKDCGFENGNWILRKLTRMCHVNLPLIDYLTDKIINDPKIGETCTPSLLLAYTTGVANADYKPAGWDRIQHILSNNLRMSEKELIEFPWLRLALNFAALDIYSPELLQHVFQEEFLNKFLSRDYNFLDNLQLLLLYQAVLTLYPSYSGPLPPKSMIEKVIAINGENINHFPLQAALEQGMGGSSYVWTKLLTKYGHFIDHLVNDVTVPADAQLILVLCLPETFFNQNCKRLRAIPSLTLKTLESMGYIVVPVSLQLWTLLPEYEKIPYLMQNIKIRCESMEDDQARFVH